MTAFRQMIDADRQFVVSTWSSSYRTSPYAGMLAMDTYADVMHREIDRILDHPSTRTIVADEPGETDHEGRPFLYGFVCVRDLDVAVARLTLRASAAAADDCGPVRANPYVYYVYVKRPYRRGLHNGLPQAMGTELFRAAGVDPRRPFEYGCHTSYCSQLSRKIPRAQFNPLPARYLTS